MMVTDTHSSIDHKAGMRADEPAPGNGAMVSQGEFRPAVVITGASGGIGRAIASVVARERGAVVLVARNPEELSAAAAEVRQAGGDPFTLELDL